MTTPPRPPDVSLGLAWLREADPVLARVIDEHPAFDPTAWMRKLPTLDLFAALVFQVIGQQISVVAATAIFAHLIERFHGLAPDPEDLVDLEPETLRELGQLTEVKGVGPWTAKGALLIALQRPDLVRTNDVALRHSIQVHYGSDHLPDPNEVAALARRWSPYGSLASSLLLANARKM